MLENFCLEISLYLERKNYLHEKYIDQFRFGLEVILSQTLIGLFIVMLGFILKKPAYGLIFVFLFGLLRQNSTGYHAKKYYSCFFLSSFSFLLCYFISSIISIHNQLLYSYLTFAFFLTIVNIVAIFYYRFQSLKYNIIVIIFVIICLILAAINFNQTSIIMFNIIIFSNFCSLNSFNIKRK